MKLFESYLDHFYIDIKQPPDKVIGALQLHINTSKRSFIAKKLLYGETYLQLANNTFKITTRGVHFEPLGGIGQINIQLLQGDTSDKTKAIIQTAPLGGYKERFAFMIFILIVFTALGLLASTDIYTIVNIFLMWTVLPLISHFWFKRNKTQLRAYAYAFLRNVLEQSESTIQR